MDVNTRGTKPQLVDLQASVLSFCFFYAKRVKRCLLAFLLTQRYALFI